MQQTSKRERKLYIKSTSPTAFSILFRRQRDKYFITPTLPSHTHCFSYPATHLPHPRPPPSTPWFPLSHFISLHLRLQFPLAPSLNRTVCLFNGLHLPLTPLNLLPTAWEVAIWMGFLFFLKIVGKGKKWNISISVNTFQIKRFIFVQNKYSWGSSSQTRWAGRHSGSSCYFISDQSHDSITIGELCVCDTRTHTHTLTGFVFMLEKSQTVS